MYLKTLIKNSFERLIAIVGTKMNVHTRNF